MSLKPADRGFVMSATLVVGAGMAGLACARALHDAGETVCVLDKGRGIGGRMATRRAATPSGELAFDHGAQYVSACSPDFAAFLGQKNGAAAIWDDGTAHTHYVGVPSMSSLPRALVSGVEVRSATKVTKIGRVGSNWIVTAGEQCFEADRLVLTVPAPQAAPLLGDDQRLVAALDAVEMAPCLALMAAFPANSPMPFVSQQTPEAALAFVARNNSKPGRTDKANTWVAHAGPEFSAAHLEESMDDISHKLMHLLCDRIGIEPSEALYVSAHRWRYARVKAALGRPFLRDESGTLHLGGDWCLGPRVEAAWVSGTEIARDILGNRPT
jgi:renalase